MNEIQVQTDSTGTIAAPITENTTISSTAVLGTGTNLPPVSIAADVHPIESALAASPDAPPLGLSARIDALEIRIEELDRKIAAIEKKMEYHGICGGV
jgi:hypothetical protein